MIDLQIASVTSK